LHTSSQNVPRFAAHTAVLMRRLARERDFERAAARGSAIGQIHA
jgi:hypothetical protein